MPMQIRRTATPNLPPTGLAEGQLGVEMAGAQPRLWVGVPVGIDASGRRLVAPTTFAGTTAPANPNLADLWFDTGANLLMVYNGTSWQSVVQAALVTVADTAPTNPQVGKLWWDSLGGQLYVWMDDGTTQQWVATSPP